MKIKEEAIGAVVNDGSIEYAWASDGSTHEFMAKGKLSELRKLWRKE